MRAVTKPLHVAATNSPGRPCLGFQVLTEKHSSVFLPGMRTIVMTASAGALRTLTGAALSAALWAGIVGAGHAAEAPSPEKLERITAFFDNEVATGKLPGAVILFRKKLDPTAHRLDQPDPVLRRLPYMSPLPAPPDMRS